MSDEKGWQVYDYLIKDEYTISKKTLRRILEVFEKNAFEYDGEEEYNNEEIQSVEGALITEIEKQNEVHG